MILRIVSILLLTSLLFVSGNLCGQEPAATPICWQFTESRNNGERQFAKILGEKIELTSTAETDFFFIEPGQPPYEKANATLLLKTVDNEKPFTFSVKVIPIHSVKYDAGTLMIKNG